MPLTLVAPLPEDLPVLTPPPNPSKPTEADRETALIWISAGDAAAAHAADTTAWDDTSSRDRACARAEAMAELEAEGWTPLTALAALRAYDGDACLALRAGQTEDGIRSRALIWLAHDVTPLPGVAPFADRAIAAIAGLRAEGWTTGTASAAIDRHGSPSAALLAGPGLRLVRTGEAA